MHIKVPTPYYAILYLFLPLLCGEVKRKEGEMGEVPYIESE